MFIIFVAPGVFSPSSSSLSSRNAQAKYAIGAGCTGAGGIIGTLIPFKENRREDGIVEGHAYSGAHAAPIDM
jgi:hypothetical protein